MAGRTPRLGVYGLPRWRSAEPWPGLTECVRDVPAGVRRTTKSELTAPLIAPCEGAIPIIAVLTGRATAITGVAITARTTKKTCGSPLSTTNR